MTDFQVIKMYMIFQETFPTFIRKAATCITLLPFFMLPFEQMVQAAEFAAYGAPLKYTSKTISQLSKSWQAYALPHKKTISPLTSLPTLANGESALPSNAGNFHGAWNASVDPRTGNVLFSVTVASALFNQGEAKRGLKLSYTGGPSAGGADTFDLGAHWQWNIGRENPAATEVAGHLTTGLTAGDGHSFTMVSDRGMHGHTLWHPLRHKLRDVKITGHPGDWIISEATGIRQRILNGYELWEEMVSGQRVYFYYDREGASDTTRHLTYICGHELTQSEQQAGFNACQNNGIHITYRGNRVIVQGHQTIVLHRISNNGIQMINKIIMPPLSSPGIDDVKSAIINLSYDVPGHRPWLLRRVDYPTGASRTFLYNGESDYPHGQTTGLSVGIHGAHIPVVTEEISESTKPGADKTPASRIWYRYSQSDGGAQAHNYLGYQGPGSVVPGRDNLLDRPHSYTYSVIKDDGVTYTTTTFNKYHLPLSIVKRDGRNHAILATSRQSYLPWRGTTFAGLPANYSMAVKEANLAYTLTEQGHSAIIAPAEVMNAMRYSNEGKVIWKKDAYGRVTVTQYCPPEGDEHCPAMDRNWPSMNYPEKVLVLPAKKSPEGSVPFLTMPTMAAPEVAVETVYDYIIMDAVGDRHPHNTGYKNLSSFLKVKIRTEGTLPAGGLDFYDGNSVSAGRALPEIAHVLLKTDYRYNTDTGDAAYAELTQLSMVKSQAAAPVVNNKRLQMNKWYYPFQSLTTGATSEQMSFAVNEHYNVVHGTHTKTLRIIPEQSTPHALQSFNTSGEGGGLNLGTIVYSLDTGVKLSREDTMGEIKTLWHYDSWNRPVEEISQPGTGGRAKVIKWTYIFTPEENAVVKTLPDGRQLKAVLSASDKVLSTWHRFADQAGVTMRGCRGWIADTESTYTAFGKVAEKTIWHAGDRPGDGSAGRAIALTTRYGYDTLNRLAWTQKPDGQVDVAVRDDAAMRIINYRVLPATEDHPEQPGAVIKVLETNVLNKQTASYLLPFDPVIKKAGSPLYSMALQLQLIQLKQHLLPTGTLQQQGSYGLLPVAGNTGLLSFVNAALKAHSWMEHGRWEYDGHGHKIEQILGNGARVRWHYDRNKLVATTLPDGRIVHDDFNVHGEKTIRCVKPGGSDICHVLGVKGYDYQGKPAWQADEYGRMIHYTHDANARLLKEVLPPVAGSPSGHVITYKYNSIGMVEKDLDGKPYQLNRYDPDTWKLTDTEDAISHVHYVYDKNSGAPVKTIHSAPQILHSQIDYPAYTEETVYDRYLTPIQVRDGAGNIHTVRHDDLGRVTATFVQLPAEHRRTLLTQQSYDAAGRVKIIENGVGIKRVLTYNSLNKLQSTLDSNRGIPLEKISYTYDPDTGNIITLTREEGNASAVQHYSYDLSNNLTAMTCHGVGKKDKESTLKKVSALCPRDTDIRGSDLTQPAVITRQEYTFDRWNNIQTVVESGVRDVASAVPYTKTTHYLYAVRGSADHPEAYDPNRLLGYRSRWNNQRYSSAAENITCDEAGRVIKDAGGNLLGYNAFGQQSYFVNAATSETTEYTYDSHGHQIAEQPFSRNHTALQAPLYMLYKGNKVIVQMQRGKDNKLHVSAELNSIARSEDGVISQWYLHDYKGDVLAGFDNKGIQKTDNIYSLYGMKYDRLSTEEQALPLRLSLSLSLSLPGQKPWWQSHIPGFNSQMSDPATGYQFLGGGYRAYNPVYRHFMAKDSFSPFIKVDGYGYGDNNPVMNTDPSGHFSKGWQIALEGMGIAGNFLISLLMPAAMGLMYGGMAVAAPASVYAAFGTGAAASGFTSGGMSAVSGGLNIDLIVHSGNRTMQKASSIIGMIDGVLLMGLSLLSMGVGLRGMVRGVGTVSRFSNALPLSGGALNLIAGGMLTGVSSPGNNFSDKQKIYMYLQSALTVLMFTSLVLDTAALGVKGIMVQSGYRVKELGLPEGNYAGETKRGQPQGVGKIRLSYDDAIGEKPESFDGWWVEGKPRRGRLSYINIESLSYEGEVNAMFQKTGKGIIYLRGGEQLVGTWSGDDPVLINHLTEEEVRVRTHEKKICGIDCCELFSCYCCLLVADLLSAVL